MFLLPSSGDTAAEIAGAEPRDQRLPKPFRGEDLERIVVGILGEQAVEPATDAPGPSHRPHRSVDPTKPSAGHRPLSALRGELDQISLSSVLVILEMERKNGILLVEHGPEIGRIFLRKGRIIRAGIEDPPSTGAPAVYQMVTWGHGTFDFLAGDVGGVDEIQASATYLLMEGARRIDEAKAARMPRPGTQENKL